MVHRSTQQEYGDYAYGLFLHTWSDENGDSYYTDYVPVKGSKDAERVNREYDGFQMEQEFPWRHTNHSI